MNYYSYKAIERDGAMIKGFVEAEDINIVYGDLSSRGLYILDVRKMNKIVADIQKGFTSQRIKRRDIIEFAKNLSVMLKAGVPILNSLSDMSITVENKHLKNIILNIRRQIETGKSFSDAVNMYKNNFPDIFVRMVRIGEETGRLDRSLSDIADHLQKMEDLAVAIKRALIYPVFAIVTTTGALIFWLAYVLPKVVTVIKDLGIKIPFVTLMLMRLGEFMQSYWYLIPLIPIAVFAVIKILKQREKTRYYIDLMKIKIPIVKLVVYNKLLAIFSEQLRILIVAGLTIDRCFDIIANVIGNEVFKRAILTSKESISAGSTISGALRKHEVFPPLVVRMIDIGETSGNLDEQFGFLSEHYIKKLNDVSQKMEKLIEPIIIVVIGIFFAIIIVGLLVPVYDLVSKMGKI
ncbi:MAG: hypothetical protein C0415_01470 [Thermodesulfovibrio sp.]|nr:hypothetical protein [Thermodesulfovibrio sp.]